MDALLSLIRDYELRGDTQKAQWIVYATDPNNQWEAHVDEREFKEIELACTYARDFGHGTAGHNRLMLIAKLNDLLNTYEDMLHQLIYAIEEG